MRFIRFTLATLSLAVLVACANTGTGQHFDTAGHFHSNGYEYQHLYYLPSQMPEGGTFYTVERHWGDDGWYWTVTGNSDSAVYPGEGEEVVYVKGDHAQPYYAWLKPLFGRAEKGRDWATVFVCDWDTPPDRYNPCDSALTRNHPMAWSLVNYTSEDGRDQMTGGLGDARFVRLDDKALNAVLDKVRSR